MLVAWSQNLMCATPSFLRSRAAARARVTDHYDYHKNRARHRQRSADLRDSADKRKSDSEDPDVRQCGRGRLCGLQFDPRMGVYVCLAQLDSASAQLHCCSISGMSRGTWHWHNFIVYIMARVSRQCTKPAMSPCHWTSVRSPRGWPSC